MSETQKILIAVAAPIAVKIVIVKMIRRAAERACAEEGMTPAEYVSQFRTK